MVGLKPRRRALRLHVDLLCQLPPTMSWKMLSVTWLPIRLCKHTSWFWYWQFQCPRDEWYKEETTGRERKNSYANIGNGSKWCIELTVRLFSNWKCERRAKRTIWRAQTITAFSASGRNPSKSLENVHKFDWASWRVYGEDIVNKAHRRNGNEFCRIGKYHVNHVASAVLSVLGQLQPRRQRLPML